MIPLSKAHAPNPSRSHMGISSIAILGAGQMGNGIAQVAACAGYEVMMIDIEQSYVDRGISSIELSLSKLCLLYTSDAADE